jgi:hypothetical protein
MAAQASYQLVSWVGDVDATVIMSLMGASSGESLLCCYPWSSNIVTLVMLGMAASILDMTMFDPQDTRLIFFIYDPVL